MTNLKNPVAPQEMLVVGAALKAGIFDALYGKPTTLDDLAQSLSLDRRALWTVIEALIGLGYLYRDKEQLELTSEAEDILYNKESDRYVGYTLIHTFNVTKSWTQLPETLRTGQPPERQRDQQDIKGFMAAMGKYAGEVAGDLVKVCFEGLPEMPRVLDLGGGPLNYARPMARAGARVTVQDVPEVCAVMEPTLLPGENIRFVPGDFTQGVAEGSFDLVFLGNICHIYGQEENIALFKRVYGTLGAGGRIAVLDLVRGVSPRAELFAVNMLVNTKTGGTWTLEQYTRWLEQAGFTNVSMYQVRDRQIILANRN